MIASTLGNLWGILSGMLGTTGAIAALAVALGLVGWRLR
jgi:hypothetical protein